MINGIKPMVSPQTPTPKKPTTNGLSFDEAMDTLLVKIQENYDTRTYGGKNMNLSLKKGRKFIKVIHNNSVWGFVSLVDGVHKGAPIKVGDIMKAAGWAAAAKHSRGSIFDSEMHKSFSWTGPNYL
jgi:hypothetical protein